MKCIYCGHGDNKVVDSRANEAGTSIRRRRECIGCQKRFTSYESVEIVPLLVIKKDGTRESFNAQKIRNGIIRAVDKRPISMEQINKVVGGIEKTLTATLDQEIPSDKIGDIVMAELKKLDEVAYVRFAAVYRQFKDISTFYEFVKNLQEG